MLRGLAAEQRAAHLEARRVDPGHEGRDALGVDDADGDVVEEEERLGAGADEVVDAHRDEVVADRREVAGRARHLELRPDAVGRGHEHGSRHPPSRARTGRRNRRGRRGRRGGRGTGGGR